MSMQPCKFTFDETPAFDGFDHGSTWNGWDNVAVTKEVLQEITRYFRKSGDLDTAHELELLDPMQDTGLYSLGWGYTTKIVRGPIRYVVRDIATKGCDFLVWGDDAPGEAQVSLESALADGLAVELVQMPADAMDHHTRRLIEHVEQEDDKP